MPVKETIERARRDQRQGKAPSTQAGEFVREEIHHIREGKHGARNTKQAIAVGLSKAWRAGVKLGTPKNASAATRRPRRGPSRLLKVLVPIVTLIFTFLLIEAGFRVAEAVRARPHATWAVYDPELGYRLNPEFGDTNAEGLRDHPITPKAGRYRILMLGDSLGYYGDTVDDTWVGRLRRVLSRSEEMVIPDVLNASIKGYTNYQELGFLKKYGLAFEPNLVGIGFVLNDLHRILHSFKVVDGRIVGESYAFAPDAFDSVDSWGVRLARKSRSLVWLRRALAGTYDDLSAQLSEGYSFEHRPDMNTAWKDQAWRSVEAQMREMQALGREHGFGLFMVVFPITDQYRPHYLAADRDYVLKPQRLAASLCRQLNIRCLDLYERLSPRDFEADGVHLTGDGRQRVAEHVAQFLNESGLIPQRHDDAAFQQSSRIHEAPDQVAAR